MLKDCRSAVPSASTYDKLYDHGPRMACLFVMVTFLVTCPFTKVEESFGIQAIHDLLYHDTSLSEYDHRTFPGVVPRTFIAPVFISILSYPSINLISAVTAAKFLSQYLVRFWIGCSILFGLCKFTSSLHHAFGRDVTQHFFMITATQFHFLFYASRPLPNTFAMVLVLPALGAWLRKDVSNFIWISAFAIIVFRFELCILMGVCLLISLIQGHASVKDVIWNAIPAGCIALSLTVLVDSLFWDRWLWPEGEVAWYNVVLNKSGDWGTSPYHWYFTSALPRALLVTAVFTPWGFYVDRYRCSMVLIPALCFVLAFSVLPHKELRFIFYTFPLFNIVAASGIANLYIRVNKAFKWKVLYTMSLLCLLANAFASSLFLSASLHNYPGGCAMAKLHETAKCNSNRHVHVHISNYAAQTGVSRFTQLCPQWRYNKTENLDFETLRMDGSVSHVIAEYDADDERQWSMTHKRMATCEVFAGISLVKHPFFYNVPFPTIKTKLALVLWERKSFR